MSLHFSLIHALRSILLFRFLKPYLVRLYIWCDNMSFCGVQIVLYKLANFVIQTHIRTCWCDSITNLHWTFYDIAPQYTPLQCQSIPSPPPTNKHASVFIYRCSSAILGVVIIGGSRNVASIHSNQLPTTNQPTKPPTNLIPSWCQLHQLASTIAATIPYLSVP